jgi:hypothetical protein
MDSTITPPRSRARHLKRAGLVLAGLSLGVAIAPAGQSSAAETATSKRAEVRTVTKTVPGPTITRTVPGPTVEKTPASCLAALDAAERGFDLAADGFAISAEIPPLIGDAARAGLNVDADALDRVTTKVLKITGRLAPILDKTTSTGTQFNAAKAACRASR